jgi:hypothetical protein
MAEAIDQNAARTGIVVNMAKNSHVYRPPPTFRAKKAGTIARRKKRKVLEKVSLPAPSAGSGAFLIAGYCDGSRQSGQLIVHSST